MQTVVIEPTIIDSVRHDREAKGLDRWDELWNGVQHMPPAPSMEHQRMDLMLTRALAEAVADRGLGRVFPQCNVADPDRGMLDYRIPDAAVVLNESSAGITENYVAGGPDFVVEIRSPGDETDQKIEFYERIGARELLVIDRDSKTLTLYSREVDRFGFPQAGSAVESHVLGLRFETVSGDCGPAIRITGGECNWMV